VTSHFTLKDVAPDVRVETERRLKALEADLARSELAKKERTLAIRYHKVKFFGTH
jgi:rRNA-processing protein Efg1